MEDTNNPDDMSLCDLTGHCVRHWPNNNVIGTRTECLKNNKNIINK